MECSLLHTLTAYYMGERTMQRPVPVRGEVYWIRNWLKRNSCYLAALHRISASASVNKCRRSLRACYQLGRIDGAIAERVGHYQKCSELKYGDATIDRREVANDRNQDTS